MNEIVVGVTHIPASGHKFGCYTVQEGLWDCSDCAHEDDELKCSQFRKETNAIVNEDIDLLHVIKITRHDKRY